MASVMACLDGLAAQASVVVEQSSRLAETEEIIRDVEANIIVDFVRNAIQ